MTGLFASWRDLLRYALNVKIGVEIKTHRYVDSVGANIVHMKCPLTKPLKATLIRTPNPLFEI